LIKSAHLRFVLAGKILGNELVCENCVSRIQDMSPLQTLSFPLVQKAETNFVQKQSLGFSSALFVPTSTTCLAIISDIINK
jgi:hypothetical protein